MCLEAPDMFESDTPDKCPVCGAYFAWEEPIYTTTSLIGNGPEDRKVGSISGCDDCGVICKCTHTLYDDRDVSVTWLVQCHYCKDNRDLFEDTIPEEPCKKCKEVLRANRG